MGRMKSERDQLEAKLQETKLELYKLENNLKNQALIVDKEKENLLSKIEGLEANLKNLTEREEKSASAKAAENESKENELKKMIEDLQGRLSAEELRASKLEIAKERAEQKAETDKMLFESKEKYLTDQKKELKKSLESEKKRFEESLGKLQTKNSSDKEKISNMQKQAVMAVESKFNALLKEKEEKHKIELKSAIRQKESLENELQAMNKNLEVAFRESDEEGQTLINRLNDYKENYDKLHTKYELLVKDRDEKVIVLSQNNEKSMHIYKERVAVLEEKIREIDMERNYALLEFEKERVRLGMELEHSQAKINELNDAIDRQTRKIEMLTRDNEKLKTERKTKRSTSGLKNSMNQSSALFGSSKRGFDSGRNFFMNRDKEIESVLNTKEDKDEKRRPVDSLLASQFKSKDYSTKDFD